MKRVAIVTLVGDIHIRIIDRWSTDLDGVGVPEFQIMSLEKGFKLSLQPRLFRVTQRQFGRAGMQWQGM